MDAPITLHDDYVKKKIYKLENCIKYKSLTNILPIDHVIRDISRSAFIGYPLSGKSSIIAALVLVIQGEDIATALQENGWQKFLLGEREITIKLNESRSWKLQFLPPQSDYILPDSHSLITLMGRGCAFVFDLCDVRSLSSLESNIITECLRVAKFYDGRRDSDRRKTPSQWDAFQSRLETKILSAVGIVILEYPETEEFGKPYAIFDDFDVPYCAAPGNEQWLGKLKEIMSTIRIAVTKVCYVVYFGSLEFPAYVYGLEDNEIFTSTTSPVRFLGIDKDTAGEMVPSDKAYYLKECRGMFSKISHDIHPQCFISRLTKTHILQEVGSRLHSFYNILKCIHSQADLHRVITDLYVQGYYVNDSDGYSPHQVAIDIKESSSSLSGPQCLGILARLGFIKVYFPNKEKESGEYVEVHSTRSGSKRDAEILNELQKSTNNLPTDSYYVFTNTIMYYSFAYFARKLVSGDTLSVQPQPFKDFDINGIFQCLEHCFIKYSKTELRENAYVDQLYLELIKLFPTYYILCRCRVRPDSQHNLDLLIYRFDNCSPTYIIEFKIPSSSDYHALGEKHVEAIHQIVEKHVEAIHQIYVCKYVDVIRKIHPNLSRDDLNVKLGKTYFLTYVTDVVSTLSMYLYKYSSTIKCDCKGPIPVCTEGQSWIRKNIGYHNYVLGQISGFDKNRPSSSTEKRSGDAPSSPPQSKRTHTQETC